MNKFDAGLYAPVVSLWGGNIADKDMLWQFDINIDGVQCLMLGAPFLVEFDGGLVINCWVIFHVKRRQWRLA